MSGQYGAYFNVAATLENGGTIEVASAHGAASPIDFLGASQLVIDHASLFGTQIGGSSYKGPLLEHFASGDAIDVHNFALANSLLNYTPSSGLLQISNGTQT